MTTSQIHVYVATSLDGFIAGPDDDLSWLPGTDSNVDSMKGESDPGALSYDGFISGIGALLMGRRTYDVVRGFDMPWPYGELPVLVATNRPLDADPPSTVQPVRGSIDDLINRAKDAAGERNVYLDGGVLIRQAAEANLIDELTITIAPVALGAGLSLFAGMSDRYPLEILSHHSFAGGMVQLRARPRRVT